MVPDLERTYGGPLVSKWQGIKSEAEELGRELNLCEGECEKSQSEQSGALCANTILLYILLVILLAETCQEQITWTPESGS